jgi:CBS domain-containing protein
MKPVAHILKSKTDQSVYTITPTARVFDALKLMAEKDIGALVVMDGEKIVGIITERDYARKVVLMARSSKETPVRDIMASAVMFVRPDQTSEECMVLMIGERGPKMNWQTGNDVSRLQKLAPLESAQYAPETLRDVLAL